MANPKTLKPFKSGYDPRRNTKGRPKRIVSRYDEIIEKALKREVLTSYGKFTHEEAITMRLIGDALKGKSTAVKLFLNYRYGKPANWCPNCDLEITESLKRKFRKLQTEEFRAERKRMLAEGARKLEEMRDVWFKPEIKKTKDR